MARIRSPRRFCPSAVCNTGHGWKAYARNHEVPMIKAEKGLSKEDCARQHLRSMERRNQHGLYLIITSMEIGGTFTSKPPKYPTDDPNYRITRRVPSRYLHYYSMRVQSIMQGGHTPEKGKCNQCTCRKIPAEPWRNDLQPVYSSSCLRPHPQVAPCFSSCWP
jgi:hypothetical protein